MNHQYSKSRDSWPVYARTTSPFKKEAVDAHNEETPKPTHVYQGDCGSRRYRCGSKT
jgi:hypothetical protein